jgi:hypothetical protein
MITNLYLKTGFFFQLCGVAFNPSVHGATIGKGRIMDLVTGLRYMESDGSIHEATTEIELKKLRGSLGTAVIGLAIEFEMQPDTGLNMGVVNQLVTDWSQHNIETIMDNIVNSYDVAEVFYNPYTDKLQTLWGTYTGGPTYDPATSIPYYTAFQASSPDLGKTGGQGDQLTDLFTLIQSIGGQGSKFFAELSSGIAALIQENQWTECFNGPRDLYFLGDAGIPTFDTVNYLVPWTHRAQALIQTRTILQAVINNGGSNWYPNLPVEFRAVDVGSSGNTYETLAPGRYLSIEAINIRDMFINNNEFAVTFEALEDAWKALSVNKGQHFGKGHSYAPVSGMIGEYPFVDTSIINNVYTTAKKAAINGVTNFYDSAGDLVAGGAYRFWGNPNNAYQPKYLNGEESRPSGNGQCISGCACDNILTCGGRTNECVASNKPKNAYCDVDCECATNNGNACRWKWYKYESFTTNP